MCGQFTQSIARSGAFTLAAPPTTPNTPLKITKPPSLTGYITASEDPTAPHSRGQAAGLGDGADVNAVVPGHHLLVHALELCWLLVPKVVRLCRVLACTHTHSGRQRGQWRLCQRSMSRSEGGADALMSKRKGPSATQFCSKGSLGFTPSATVILLGLARRTARDSRKASPFYSRSC